ncbi:hypothetical protein HID58_038209, partial [Brassica napus]
PTLELLFRCIRSSLRRRRSRLRFPFIFPITSGSPEMSINNENRSVKKDGEMMGIDMFLIDVKATLIQSSINYHRLNTFKHLLNECSLYELIVL